MTAVLFLATLAPIGVAGAQLGTGRLFGAVFDSATGTPVVGADIVHLGDGRKVTTDSLGGYVFEKLPSGIVRFIIRVPGFPLTRFVVALSAGEHMERDVVLDSTAVGRTAPTTATRSSRTGNPQALPKVVVAATPSAGIRFVDFERRRRTGRGQYLDLEQIEEANYASVPDAMRGLRGVNLDCSGTSATVGCSIKMARAPARCSPDFVVDERVDNLFGPTTAIRDIQAIEVYTGPSELPGEFAGRNSGCGLVVIWTKSGPPRRTKRDSTKRSRPHDSS